MKRYKLILVILILPLLLSSCRWQADRPVIRSFYYWKSSFELKRSDVNLLQKLKIKRIYLKFFDVVWSGEPVPVAGVTFKSAVPDFLEIVPTVFITNETLERLPAGNVPDLADKIAVKLERMADRNQLARIPEAQLDCDWTSATRDKYFELLRRVRSRIAERGWRTSATIRLHQIKYRSQTGVPPCERGMLMFYNMAPVNDAKTKNSIIDPNIGKEYISNLKSYPMPLDLALPIFSWGVVFQDDRCLGLVNGVRRSEVLHNPNFLAVGPNYYRLKSNDYIHQTQLYKGDLLRVEEADYQNCRIVIGYLRNSLPQQSTTAVALFHFDPETLRGFGYARLENLFAGFR